MIKNVKMYYTVPLIAKQVVIERVARKSKGSGTGVEKNADDNQLQLENPFPDRKPTIVKLTPPISFSQEILEKKE